MKIIQLLASQITIPREDLEIPKQDGDIVGSGNIEEILQIVFGLGATISVLVIVIAGIMFILSRGDPQKSATARNAIIYAGIGLAIMVSAFAIVGFVLESV